VSQHTAPTWTSVLLAEGTIVTLVGAPHPEASPDARQRPRTLRVGSRDERTGLFQVSNIARDESEMFPLESYLMHLKPGTTNPVIVKYSPCASREWAHLAQACQHGSGRRIICAWECTTAPASSAPCLGSDEIAAVFGACNTTPGGGSVTNKGLLLMPHEARKLALAESLLDRHRTSVVSPGGENDVQEVGTKKRTSKHCIANEECARVGDDEGGLGQPAPRRAHCRKPMRTKRLSDAVSLQDDAAAVLPIFWGEKPASQGIPTNEVNPQDPSVDGERQSHFSAESHALANSDSSTNEVQPQHLRRRSAEDSDLNAALLQREPPNAAAATGKSALPLRRPTLKQPKVRSMRQVCGKVSGSNASAAAYVEHELHQVDHGTAPRPGTCQMSKFSLRDLNILSLRQLCKQPACRSESNSVSDAAGPDHTHENEPLPTRPTVKRVDKRNATVCRNDHVGARERKPNRRYCT